MAKQIGKPVRGSTTGRPIMVLFDVLGEKWTLRILWELESEPLNFRGLRERCENVSPTLLNKRLKSLRELKLVQHDEQGYSLTQEGKGLGKHLLKLNLWAEDWRSALK